MKSFICFAVLLAVASAAPTDDNPKVKRGIYGASPLIAPSSLALHAPYALPAAPLISHAPIYSKAILPAAPLISHSPLLTHSPLISHAPIYSKTILPSAHLAYSAPLISHAPAYSYGHSLW